ncbi:receptor-like protein kinase HERK 1 [Rutidosis leptorrhynchoides]|uniref:receptor-like protein kinase HERK 1 n=1 Tax=Rutidosis leptorrhynchoides TaxID=125765 RepID=UPI003A9A0B7C
MSFNDIQLATQDFSRANCIGGGGFGQVYKGKLAHTNNVHSTIVVKKLDKTQGERQYYNELQILYKYNHENAKVGDFGLSLISPINQKTNFTIDHPCGTRDYVDPMYLKSGILTVESDVYSFGVALFEILCGRATYTIPRRKSVSLLSFIKYKSLLSFIKYKFENGKEDDVVFKAIKEEIVPESLSTFLNIVYKCLDEDRENRPTMKDVLVQLEKALEIQDKLYDAGA